MADHAPLASWWANAASLPSITTDKSEATGGLLAAARTGGLGGRGARPFEGPYELEPAVVLVFVFVFLFVFAFVLALVFVLVFVARRSSPAADGPGCELRPRVAATTICPCCCGIAWWWTILKRLLVATSFCSNHNNNNNNNNNNGVVR